MLSQLMSEALGEITDIGGRLQQDDGSVAHASGDRIGLARNTERRGVAANAQIQRSLICQSHLTHGVKR
jgi:hypothetical protein